MRQILMDLLDHMIPPAERLAQVRASVNLEVSLNRQGDRVIVHLVQCPQARRSVSSFNEKDYVNQDPIIDEMPTVSGARLSLAETLVGSRKIKLLATGMEIAPDRRENGVVTITVPDFQISAVLVME